MAKKSSTIHIENRSWNYIQDYMLKNGIDSRNTAIEHILLEHQTLMMDLSKKTVIAQKEPEKTENVSIEYTAIEENETSGLVGFDVDSLYDAMPDE